MHIIKTGLSLVALALVALAFASPSDAQPIHGKASIKRVDTGRDAITRLCSTSGFNSAKEYNSSDIPWYTYSNCMTEHGMRP